MTEEEHKGISPDPVQTVRVQFDLLKSRLGALDDLMRVSGMEKRKELYENAFEGLEWMIRETLEGREVGSVDESGTFVPLRFSCLTRVRSINAHITNKPRIGVVATATDRSSTSTRATESAEHHEYSRDSK